MWLANLLEEMDSEPCDIARYVSPNRMLNASLRFQARRFATRQLPGGGAGKSVIGRDVINETIS
jgi:hypothetical protein